MNTQSLHERFLKLGDVEKMLGVSRSTVWRWHAERGLKVVTVGAVTRIRERDLQAFLQRHESNSASVGAEQMDPAAGETREPPE